MKISREKWIGFEESEVSAGGCSAVFFRNSFQEATKITAIAEIDKTKWPPVSMGRVVSPIFTVDTSGVNTEAKVKLMLWCVKRESCGVQEEDVTVRVLLFSQQLGIWATVTEDKLDCLHLVFDLESCNFGPLVAVVPTNHLVYRYHVMITVYGSERTYLTFIHLNNELFEIPVMKEVANFSEDFQLVESRDFFCSSGREIELRISCRVPFRGFTFSPAGPFRSNVSETIANGDMLKTRCTLQSDSTKVEELEVGVAVFAEDLQVFDFLFEHQWQPGYHY